MKIIRKLGFPVSAVWNGREALDYVANSLAEDGNEGNKPVKPDIILMDVQMPTMDGYEATRILRGGGKDYTILEEKSSSQQLENRDKNSGSSESGRMKPLPDLPIIAMTASAIQGDNEKCRDAGMDDYLPKPVEKDKLEDMLVKWARKTKS